MKEVKCPNCKFWNLAVDNCVSCGTAISSKQLNIEFKNKIENDEVNKKPTKIELYIKKQLNSTNFFVKYTFYLIYSVWVVFMAILAFILYIIVGTPA